MAYSASACTPLLVTCTKVYLCTGLVMAYVALCSRERACDLVFCLSEFEITVWFSGRNGEPDDQPCHDWWERPSTELVMGVLLRGSLF